MKRVTLEEIGKKHLIFHVPKKVEIEGQEIQAMLKMEYELDFEAGVAKGGTCLVYHAYKIVKSSEGFLKHKVILKEFYPELETEETVIVRGEDGSLEISDAVKEHDVYRTKLERFQQSYKMFVKLHNEKKTNNYMIKADELIEANGTWYLAVDYNEACTLSEYMEKQPDLYEFCKVLKRVVGVVSVLHEAGYLHLDLTPGNLIVFQDGAVRLLDTDSFLRKDELRSKKPVLSWSEGYAAPELFSPRAYQRLSRMGERSDIFSVGAILYRYLYGEYFEGVVDEKSLEEKIEEKYAFNQKTVVKCPQNAMRMLKEFISIALSAEMGCRYETMNEAEGILEGLLPLIEPKRIQLLDNFRKNANRVYGREEKIEELEDAFEKQGQQGKHRLVLISGIGGIGKSTLARAYAEKYLDQYDTIVEVAAESAEEVVRSITLINFDDNRLEERVRILQALLQERKCLIIVHDYNQREDETFAMFSELSCDVILTSWADWKESGVSCIALKSNDLTEHAAVYIFEDIYLKNAQSDCETLKAMLAREREALKLLLHQVDYHPLTIKLLAKQMSYLAGAEQTPSQMLEELEQYGISENHDITFQNQKDGGNVELGNIFFHLQKIYGMALQKGRLSESEIEVLRYMMLLSGEKGVCVERFQFWTGLREGIFVTLSSLCKKGWLEYHPKQTDELWLEARTWDCLTFRKDLTDEELFGKKREVRRKKTTIGTYYMPMGISQVLYSQKHMRSTVNNIEVLMQTFYEMMLFSGSEKHYATAKLLLNFIDNLYRCIEKEEKWEYVKFLSNYGRIVCNLEVSSKSQRRRAVEAVETAAQMRSKVNKENNVSLFSFYESMSYVYFYNEHYEQAVYYCEEALKNIPVGEFERMERESLHSRLADSYLAMGDYKKAEMYVKKYADINVCSYPKEIGRLGKIEALKGNYIEAIDYLEQAKEKSMKIEGDAYTMRVAKLDFELAPCYWECGRKVKAIECLERSVAAYEEYYGQEMRQVHLVKEKLEKYRQEL